MTQVVFTAIGGAVGGPIGAMIGLAAGVALDNSIVNSFRPSRQVGPRLDGLRVQGSAEGAGLACVFGRARVAGQVIWATRFLEQKRKNGGGKGGQKSHDYAYSLSFAVGLGEGEIDGVGRVWADGMPMDMSNVTWRVHRGGEAQMPDPLIEAIEGQAPAYRGTAYVVFEDLPLEAYGNRVPQLSFEVFRRAKGSEARLEDRLEGVCLIPGAGEFVLADRLVTRRLGYTRYEPENGGAGQARADLEVSLDQLQMQLPHVKRVNLVIGWFGTDVRAGLCRVRPGVEREGRFTVPMRWSVAGQERHEAYVVSQRDGAPAYGGTPDDESVRQAIRALKARGMEVTLYPFVFMDCEGYPWRGRVAGTDGAGAAEEVASLFGRVDEWGLRRQVLHYARIAAEEGAHGLVIGSEMRGLTLTRDEQGGFPAVAQYRRLAGECRAIVGASVELTYAADWSEYAGLRAGGEVRFHLDPLWADANIDYVGIDWYPPMGDWRAGDGGVDAVGAEGPWDADYLARQVAGGRDFDWFYASAADEEAQVRTPIVDGAYGEDWIWRVKDLKGWWSNPHHDRVDGERQAMPTAWQPCMKPVRLMEFGCAAVDRGGNAPNLFQDPKSTESALPPYSDGTRDDRMQRALLEAVLAHFADAANNPVSPVYGGPMLAGADVWCWDARPWPAFPAREDLWSDAGAWRTGHWLNGRVQGTAADMVEGLLRRAGLDGGWTVEGLDQTLAGVALERPMTTRAALSVLLPALGAVASERDGRVVVSGRGTPAMTIDCCALAMPDEGDAIAREREQKPLPQAARVRFVLDTGEYHTAAVVVRSNRTEARPEGAAPLNDVVDVDLPCVIGEAEARRVARRILMVQGGERRVLSPGPLESLMLEVGDVVELEREDGLWRVVSLAYEETTRAVLEPVVEVSLADVPEDWRGGDGGGVVGPPFVRFLDIPGLQGQEEDGRLLVAAAADPWWPMAVHMGASQDSLSQRCIIEDSAVVGEVLEVLAPGEPDRWDEVNRLVVRLEGGRAASLTRDAVLEGGNLLAVEAGSGWEILQYRHAAVRGGEVWELSGLLRGCRGTEAAAKIGARAGAAVVVLDSALARVDMADVETGVERLWRVGPRGLPPGGDSFSEGRGVWRKAQAMAWAPVHLTGRWEAQGLRLSWVARNRMGPEGWNEEPEPVDRERYRVCVVKAGETVREWFVDQPSTIYGREAFEEDFPLGDASGASAIVAQMGADGRWGHEVVLSLE